MGSIIHRRQVAQAELVAQGPLVDVLFTPHPAECRAPGAGRYGLAADLSPDDDRYWRSADDRRGLCPAVLQLEPMRFQAIAGVTGDLDCPVYRLQINIRSSSHDDRRIQFAADIVAIPPVPELARPHVGLLGRDFLQLVRFEYDGPSGVYQLIDEHATRS